MGILKRAADITYAFRFVRLLVMKWESWDAYKLGIIDKDGKRVRNVKLDDDEKKSAYTPFIRLCANIKRLVSSVPGGGSKLGSFASALFLIKEKYTLSDSNLDHIMSKVGLDTCDLLNENSSWFILEDRQISPGMYRIYNDKLLNKTYDDLVNAKDKIRIEEDAYPVGDVFGIDVYEAIHINTNQNVYVTVSEIYKWE